jgi:hypothetical protein
MVVAGSLAQHKAGFKLKGKQLRRRIQWIDDDEKDDNDENMGNNKDPFQQRERNATTRILRTTSPPVDTTNILFMVNGREPPLCSSNSCHLNIICGPLL